jgi:DNA polymerase III subunit alpha
MSPEDYFRHASFEGLEARLLHLYPAQANEAKSARAMWSGWSLRLNTILKMGFPGYFLIVGDFIHWAKANGCPVGPGRGSGAGSLVAYALKITDLDPAAIQLAV